MINKIKITLGLIVTSSVLFIGCGSDAKIASSNLSKKADNFELNRRIVFYNGITGEYILVINGRCSVESNNNKLEVTCKTGANSFKKHYLGLSDNVTYFSEQLDDVDVSTYHYKVVFKPQSIIGDIDFKGSLQDTPKIDNKD